MSSLLKYPVYIREKPYTVEIVMEHNLLGSYTFYFLEGKHMEIDEDNYDYTEMIIDRADVPDWISLTKRAIEHVEEKMKLYESFDKAREKFMEWDGR